MAIQAEEGGDAEILSAAALLHDCVAIDKSSPLRSTASLRAADKARVVLADMDWAQAKVDATAHAIEAHSFSGGIPPQTLEAKILQDADRLDALGMIGAARCFYVAGTLGRSMYDPMDPIASQRAYDDTRFTVDHFHTKLLTLADSFQTTAGSRMAKTRQDTLKLFLDKLMEEIDGIG